MPRIAQSPAALPVPSLELLLQGLTNDDLKWYASALPGPTPTRKADLVAHIRAPLLTLATLHRLWEQLAPDQRDALSEVVHTFSGRYNADVLTAKYPHVSAPRPPRVRYDFMGADKAEDRLARPFDLFFVHTDEYGTLIASDVVALLKAFVPPPPAANVRSSDEPPTLEGQRGAAAPQVFVSDAEAATFHDLSATLLFIAQGKASVGAATQLPSLATLRALRARLLIGDYFAEDYERADDALRPFALIVLVQAAKWAAPGIKGSKLELTKAGSALLAAPLSAAHIRELWARWLKSTLLDELSRVRAIRGQQAKGVRLTKPADRRPLLAEMLRRAPAGRWIALDDFFRFMRAEGQSPLIERNETSGLHIGSYNDYGWMGYASNYWDIVVGSYLRALLFEYAATLGLVDLAYTYPEETPHDFGEAYGLDEFEYLSRYDGLLAFRITRLGAYALGLSESYTPPAPTFDTSAPLLKVLPNRDIVITDAQRLAPNDRAFIERIAAPQSEGVYRLDRDLLIESFEHGLPLDQVRAFLSARSGTAEADLPQLVRVFFADTEQRLGAVRDRGAMVVLDGDPYLLTELAHSAGLRALAQLGTLGERTVLLIPQEHEAAARKQLKKLGYVPKKG